MRQTTPSDKNVRNLKAEHTPEEKALFLSVQQAVRDAALKVGDRATATVRDVVVQTSATPGPYSTDVVSFTLYQQEEDEYPVYLTISVKLTQPSRPNPDFNPDAPEDWHY
jgi:hypothetical protein